MTAAPDPLYPASYDVVWSLAVIVLIVAVVAVAVFLVRAARRPQAPDVVKKVESLAALRDSGAISAEEYQERKNRVLDRI